MITIGINMWRLWPYTFLAGTQLAYDDGAQAAAATCFTAMSVNVKVENDRYAQIADQIERIDPDILFLRMDLGDAEIWNGDMGLLDVAKMALGMTVHDDAEEKHVKETSL